MVTGRLGAVAVVGLVACGGGEQGWTDTEVPLDWLRAPDSSLHLLDAGGTRAVIRTSGPPADIGIDTSRRRVAVPYVGMNRVDVWQLPPE